MRVLFVSKGLHSTSGEGVGVRMHLDALKKCVGEENLHIIDLAIEAKRQVSDRYIAFGKYSGKLERIKRILQKNTFYFNNKIIREICDYAEEHRIDVVFLDDSTFGNLAVELKKRTSAPVVAFYHDVKAELYPIWIKRSKGINKIEFRIGMYNERILANAVDANIVLNKPENALLQKYYSIDADYLLPVCVPKNEEPVVDVFENNGKKHILFVGTSYIANIQGITWFYENVFKIIDEEFDLYIVGKGLECLRETIHDANVKIIGFAQSLASYYYYSDVVIAPLWDGGGMKIKTAEAISYGKVFVGSPESLHGYSDELCEMKGQLVFECDTKEEFVGAFMTIKDSQIQKQNECIVEIYNKLYSPDAAFRIVNNIINESYARKVKGKK